MLRDNLVEWARRMKLRLFFDGDGVAWSAVDVVDVFGPVFVVVVVVAVDADADDDESEKYLNEMRGDDFIKNEFLGGKLFDVAETFCGGNVSDFSLMGVVLVLMLVLMLWRRLRSGMLLLLLLMKRLCDLLWTSALMGVDVLVVVVLTAGVVRPFVFSVITIMLLVVLLFDNAPSEVRLLLLSSLLLSFWCVVAIVVVVVMVDVGASSKSTLFRQTP